MAREGLVTALGHSVRPTSSSSKKLLEDVRGSLGGSSGGEIKQKRDSHESREAFMRARRAFFVSLGGARCFKSGGGVSRSRVEPSKDQWDTPGEAHRERGDSGA